MGSLDFTDAIDMHGHFGPYRSERHEVINDGMSAEAGIALTLVSRIGAQRILFGTDTPLYFAASQKTRIAQAGITLEQKRAILRDNARALLFPGGLP